MGRSKRKFGFSKSEADLMKEIVKSYKFHPETSELLIKVIINNAKKLDDFDPKTLAKFHCDACIASRKN